MIKAVTALQDQNQRYTNDIASDAPNPYDVKVHAMLVRPAQRALKIGNKTRRPLSYK